jgi:two-component system alkaline phosphatase synthesis response regulator PhoP
MTDRRPEHKETLLIIEDDRALREGLAMNFRLRGFEVLVAADGEEGMRMAFDNRPDLIVLDLMLPGFSGLDILDELRSRDEPVPVLILSAQGSLDARVRGLDLGADDYLSKPFELPELLARVDALLRRGQTQRARQPVLSFGEVRVDPAARRVTRAGKEIPLSAREFDLLVLLARSPGQTFSRETILHRIWGWGFDGTPRTVDNYIMSIRQKLEENPAKPRHLHTIRQVGYRLDP